MQFGTRPVIRRRVSRRLIQTLAVYQLFVFAWAPSFHAQENSRRVVFLVRVDGSFGRLVPAQILWSGEKSETVVTIDRIRIEVDSLGFLSRLRSEFVVTNNDKSRKIKEAEWRLDIYDESIRNLSRRVLLTDKVRVDPGASSPVRAKFGAVLPDRMLVLLQLTRINFLDGSAWSPNAQCELEPDFVTIRCK